MEDITEKPVGQIVAENYDTFQVFEKFGIDYFNKGKQSLKEAAKESNIETEVLLAEIVKIQESGIKKETDFNSMDLDVLTDYIVNTHHKYAEKQGPVVKNIIETLCQDYGEQHPELLKIKEHLNIVIGQIAVHQKKEELILFPYIRKMADAVSNNKAFVRPPMTSTAERPVDMLTHEHTDQGEAFEKIELLSEHYTPPADVDDYTYEDAFNLLNEFQGNLHKHLHLENNILFPKALKLDK